MNQTGGIGGAVQKAGQGGVGISNGQKPTLEVSVCIEVVPGLCANGHVRRISCAFRLMSMRLDLVVKGRTTAMTRPLGVVGGTGQRVRLRLCTRKAQPTRLR